MRFTFLEKKFNNSLLKIDVEGHELNVLEGSKNIIKKIRYVIIEDNTLNLTKQLSWRM